LARYYYANLLTGLKRLEEAIAEARAALKLDPISTSAEANLAILYYSAGRYDEALVASGAGLRIRLSDSWWLAAGCNIVTAPSTHSQGFQGTEPLGYY
jgi:tetratricopeptide (TPR) repeat protein